jgi:hypothetical protein
MNLGDMIYAVRQSIQTMDAFTANLNLDEQITDIINQKIETFVRQEYFKNKIQLPDGSFEVTKEALYNLQTLFIIDDININSNSDFSFYLKLNEENSLSSSLKFIIAVEAFIDGLVLDSPVRIVPHDKITELLRNPFRTTSILSPLGSVQNDTLKVYVKNKFTVNSLKITYIKEPKYFSTLPLSPMNDSSDLPEHTHQTIVDMVVQNILEKNESPRYQQNVNENILNK